MWWTFSLPVAWRSLGIFLHTMSSSTWLLNITSHDMRITKLCINLFRFTLWMYGMMSELMSRLSWLTYVWGWPYARSWTPNQEHLWCFWAWFVLLGQLSMLELAGAVYAIHWDLKTGIMWKLPTSWFPGSFVAKSFNEQATLTTDVCYDSLFMHIFLLCLFRPTAQPQIAKGLHLDLADWEPGRGVVRRAAFIVIVKMASKDVGLVWNLPSIWALYI